MCALTLCPKRDKILKFLQFLWPAKQCPYMRQVTGRMKTLKGLYGNQGTRIFVVVRDCGVLSTGLSNQACMFYFEILTTFSVWDAKYLIFIGQCVQYVWDKGFLSLNNDTNEQLVVY